MLWNTNDLISVQFNGVFQIAELIDIEDNGVVAQIDSELYFFQNGEWGLLW